MEIQIKQSEEIKAEQFVKRYYENHGMHVLYMRSTELSFKDLFSNKINKDSKLYKDFIEIYKNKIIFFGALKKYINNSNGVADFMVFNSNYLFFVEVKTRTDSIKLDQLKFAKFCQSHNIFVKILFYDEKNRNIIFNRKIILTK